MVIFWFSWINFLLEIKYETGEPQIMNQVELFLNCEGIPVTKYGKSCKSLRPSTVLSHRVHLYCVRKAEERCCWLRNSELKISARLRACNFWILIFDFRILNFSISILNLEFSFLDFEFKILSFKFRILIFCFCIVNIEMWFLDFKICV